MIFQTSQTATSKFGMQENLTLFVAADKADKAGVTTHTSHKFIRQIPSPNTRLVIDYLRNLLSVSVHSELAQSTR